MGAIGDSAVIGYAGLGAQAISAAPDLCKDWAAILPIDALERREDIVDRQSGTVAPAKIRSSGKAPLVNLAILDRDGTRGLIGRGFYEPAAQALLTALT